MPRETHVTRCGNCGAALVPQPGAVALDCGYCRQSTYLAPSVGPAPVPFSLPGSAASGANEGLHERLSCGPVGERRGSGVRHRSATASSLDVLAHERGLWPVGGRASSTYGGGWSPSALLGPPRVFPRYGDISGAWAPGPRTSPAEWIEVEYSADVAVSAVRVFETNRAGSTYAVLDLTHGEDLLYAGEPSSESAACVLEVAINPPRPIRRLRIYLVNPGWTEVDTVGLIAAQPLPEGLRTRATPVASASAFLRGLALIGAVVAAMAVVGPVATSRKQTPARGSSAPSRPMQSIVGAYQIYSTADPASFDMRRVTWASVVAEFSSQYLATRNAATAVIGPPDVYPQSGDLDGAWASRETDAGTEWITVRFAAPVLAAGVIWLETLNPGAAQRIDDMSDPSNPVVLWEGTTATPTAPSVAGEIALPSPRYISALRLVLDTRRVAGWNEIDAIGLVPAGALR